MRFFNNTNFDDDFMIDFIKPHYWSLKSEPESIEVSDTGRNTFKIVFFGIECVLLEVESNKDHTVQGSILWFNESSGEGMVRLDNGRFFLFYSCNVIGADSYYPELVTNIQLKEGQRVSAVLSGDLNKVKELGLIQVTII